jgi:hypothetical protein
LLGERYDKLLEIGFDFENDQTPWEERFQQLVEFHKEQRHFEVPFSNHALYRWLVVQRDQYRRNCKVMTGHRYYKLQAIGFEWEPRRAIERVLV